MGTKPRFDLEDGRAKGTLVMVPPSELETDNARLRCLLDTLWHGEGLAGGSEVASLETHNRVRAALDAGGRPWLCPHEREIVPCPHERERKGAVLPIVKMTGVYRWRVTYWDTLRGDDQIHEVDAPSAEDAITLFCVNCHYARTHGGRNEIRKLELVLPAPPASPVCGATAAMARTSRDDGPRLPRGASSPTGRAPSTRRPRHSPTSRAACAERFGCAAAISSTSRADESFAHEVATLKGANIPDDVANRWASQSLEWVAIRDALIDLSSTGRSVTAHDVTLEQIKRALSRGERLLTYADLVAAIHPKSEDPR